MSFRLGRSLQNIFAKIRIFEPHTKLNQGAINYWVVNCNLPHHSIPKEYCPTLKLRDAFAAFVETNEGLSRKGWVNVDSGM